MLNILKMEVVFSSLMLNTTRKYELSTFRNKKKFAQNCAIIIGDFLKILLIFLKNWTQCNKSIANKPIWPYSSIKWEIKPNGDTNRDVLNRLLFSSNILYAAVHKNGEGIEKHFHQILVNYSFLTLMMKMIRILTIVISFTF